MDDLILYFQENDIKTLETIEYEVKIERWKELLLVQESETMSNDETKELLELQEYMKEHDRELQRSEQAKNADNEVKKKT